VLILTLFQESSLLFSSSSALLPALPFAFIAKSNDVVSSIALQNPRDIPLNLEIRKVYYTPHIEEIKHELDAARTIGSAVAEERFNAMKSRQEARMRDTQDWERWQNVDSGHIYSPMITRQRTSAMAVRPSTATTIPNVSNLPPAQLDESRKSLFVRVILSNFHLETARFLCVLYTSWHPLNLITFQLDFPQGHPALYNWSDLFSPLRIYVRSTALGAA